MNKTYLSCRKEFRLAPEFDSIGCVLLNKMPERNEIVNPNENLEIPSWINEKYFQEVLSKDVPDHVKVLKFTPVAAIPPGENFTSTMLRIYIDLQMKDGSTKTKTYIFKTCLPEDRGGKEMEQFGLFPKEMKMYSDYLPAFEALYKAAGVNLQLAPKCLHTEKRNDRLKGLDNAHMKHALEKLAEYHAASAVYAEQNGPYPKEFEEGFVSLGCKDFLCKDFRGREAAYKQCMANWGMNNPEKYINSFPTEEQYWALATKSLEVNPDEFNVLIHGDFWSSNLMCSYLPDGRLDQLLLLDFQIGRWGSPAQDLLFFLTLSPEKTIRLKEFDTFVAIYWERLIECLKLLKYKKRLPELRDIHISMYQKNNAFYAFFAISNHLPIILFPSDKDSNMHSLKSDSKEAKKFRLRMFSNSTLAEVMKDLYPFYYNRGLLNFSDYET